jgi:hypothetical protein
MNTTKGLDLITTTTIKDSDLRQSTIKDSVPRQFTIKDSPLQPTMATMVTTGTMAIMDTTVEDITEAMGITDSLFTTILNIPHILCNYFLIVAHSKDSKLYL